MLEKLNLLHDDDEPNPDIADINAKIAEINDLIDEYNVADMRDKAELLMEIYQLHSSLDAYIASIKLLYDPSLMKKYVGPFYKKCRDDLAQEFQSLGVKSFRASEINYWGIQNSRSEEGVFSPTRFAQITKPGFFSRLFGSTSSSAINEATRLLSEISQSSIKENTKENYQQLMKLNHAIRELASNSKVSQEDKHALRQLIATINGRIHSILEHNELLKRSVEPREFPLADSIATASNKAVLDLKGYLENTRDFNEETFHQTFDNQFPGLAEFQVNYLGGENSKNYLITNLIAQEKFILKITPSRGNSSQTAERLKRTEVNNNLTEIFTSRERIGENLSSLEITEFCANGNVLSYGQKMDSPEATLISASDIYHQMTDILINFGANNALFPDMKPTNFLVTEEGKLTIADTKSFIDTPGGLCNFADVNKDQLYLYTEGIQPPEYYTTNATQVDKLHSYLLGMSLYVYLTKSEIEDIPKEYDPTFFNLEHPIFESEKGLAFKELLQGLLKENPEERLGLHEARERLHAIQHKIKVEHSPFKSRTEAYLFSIHHLIGLQNTHQSPVLDAAINELKILVENHEKNPIVAATLIEKIAKTMQNSLSDKEVSDLHSIAKAIRTSAYQQTVQEKYENPLARRFESEMQIALLQNPTSSMMQSVGKISAGLVNVFEQMEQKGMQDQLDDFVQSLTSGVNSTGFGSQKEPATYNQIKEKLIKNDPKDLNQIMFIQFLFAQNMMRYLPEDIQAPNKAMPSGKLKQLIETYENGQYKDNPAAFFDSMDMGKLRLISDVKIYGSKLYSAESGRGLKGELPPTYSSQMGVMLVGQNEHGLPVDPSSWTPDAKYQEANLSSIYVRDLIENEAVYAAGPSGMTSLFLNIMEMYGNFSQVEEKQNYLAAVSAYMVSGGLHSLHEVIGPAQYALDLVPGYNVSPPEENSLATPPNFHQFYEQQMAIDPEFQERYTTGWDNLMASYVEQQQLHVHKPILDLEINPVIQRVVSKEKVAINNELTSKSSADQLVDVLNNALIKYHDHISTSSPIGLRTGLLEGHGESGIERGFTLVEKARNATSLEGVIAIVGLYFNNKLTSLSGESFSNISRANEYSFISFLLNELKDNPDLVAFINQSNLLGSNLSLSSSTDYTAESASTERSQAFESFSAIPINSEISKSVETTLSMKSKLQEHTQNQQNPEQKDEDSSHEKAPKI